MCFLQRSSDLLRLSSCRTRDGQVNCRHLVVIWTKDNCTSLIVSVGEWNSGRTVNDGRGAFVSSDSGHFSQACENLAMAGTKNAPRHLDWLGSISGDDVKCGMSRLVALVHTTRVYLQFLHFSSLHKNLNSKLQLGSGKQETKSRSIKGPLRNFTFFIFYILRWVPHRHIRDYVFTLLYLSFQNLVW